MSLNPLGSPLFQAFDANGDPLVGGQLYTYAAGTSTPALTYSDSAGSVGAANENPIVLDANGQAQVWLTPGVNYKFVLTDPNSALLWEFDNYPSPLRSSATTDEVATDPGGRLTLTSGTPVTTSDVTGASTVYYAPYKSDKVPLYDGSAWALYSIGSSGLSQTTSDTTKSPYAVTTNANYDLFVWNDSGTVRLSRGFVWSSATSRGTGAGTTELEQVNGRYVNKNSISNGPGAQRGLYVGTVRSDGSFQINDSMAKRHVWNTFNRVVRPMKVIESTDTWTYTVATLRQANGSTANQLDFVRGLDEDAVRARVQAMCSTNNAGGNNFVVAVGLDSTSAKASDSVTGWVATAAASIACVPVAEYVGLPGLGRHFLAWLEETLAAVGTTTWNGDGGVSTIQSGILGEMMG